MKVTARELARRVLARVEDGGFATLALAGELSRSGLADNDRALATELVYGTLKQRLRLDRALASCAPRGIAKLDERTLDALRLGAYQLLFLRVPAHAAVDDAVSAVSRIRGAKLAGFANALLRRLSSSGEPPLPPGDVELATSTPHWLAALARAAVGDEELPSLLAAFNVAPPTWLRANTLRTTRDELAAQLHALRPHATFQTTPLAPDALAVRGAGDLFSAETQAATSFTAQDLGAQLVVRLVEPRAGERILDACSGVGGKATHLAALTGDQADIDAADLSPRKLELAADLAHRLGVRRVRSVAADLTDPAAAGLADRYDRVLLDAPCSGLGVLRRHPEAKWRRTSDDVTSLAALQARLLDALAPRVAPGGLLVYAVCTFTDAEGPGQIGAFLARHPDFSADGEPLRTWPHRDDADAFFAVRLHRR